MGGTGTWLARLGSTPQCAQPSFDSLTNRIFQINGTTAGYDLAGNLTSDGIHTYQWDAEGRLRAAGGTRNATFIYNASGQLAETNDTNYREEFLYAPGGENLGDFDGRGNGWWDELVPFAGRNLANNVSWAGTATLFPAPERVGQRERVYRSRWRANE